MGGWLFGSLLMHCGGWLVILYSPDVIKHDYLASFRRGTYNGSPLMESAAVVSVISCVL